MDSGKDDVRLSSLNSFLIRGVTHRPNRDTNILFLEYILANHFKEEQLFTSTFFLKPFTDSVSSSSSEPSHTKLLADSLIYHLCLEWKH